MPWPALSRLPLLCSHGPELAELPAICHALDPVPPPFPPLQHVPLLVWNSGLPPSRGDFCLPASLQCRTPLWLNVLGSALPQHPTRPFGNSSHSVINCLWPAHSPLRLPPKLLTPAEPLQPAPSGTSPARPGVAGTSSASVAFSSLYNVS